MLASSLRPSVIGLGSGNNNSDELAKSGVSGFLEIPEGLIFIHPDLFAKPVKLGNEGFPIGLALLELSELDKIVLLAIWDTKLVEESLPSNHSSLLLVRRVIAPGTC